MHGQDRALLAEVARFLEKGGVEPVILKERSETGHPLIQELVRVSRSARFAVVLATADDEGRLQGSEKLSPRARQNVVLELGYFLHQLGPSRVAVLASESIEHPSDYQGVTYIPLRGGDDWRVPLAKALKKAFPTTFRDRKAFDL